jgi:hypothetical protein
VTTSIRRASGAPPPTVTRSTTPTDRTLWLGLGLIVVLAFLLRLPHLDAGIFPGADGDEGVVVTRALGVTHGHLPSAYDWPTGSMFLLAGVLKVLGLIHASWVNGARAPYVIARGVFLVVAVSLVLLSGILGAHLAPPPHRRVVAWTSAGAVAVSFLAVREARNALPDHLQAVLAVGSLLMLFAYRSHSSRWWLVGAGALAGMSAGTKYLGGLVVLPAALYALWPPEVRASVRSRLTDLSIVALSSAVAFVATVPGVVLHPHQFWTGFDGQVLHQSGGHLGYSGNRAWWFYLHEALPGNWGWLLTSLAVIGVGLVILTGRLDQRLLLAFVVPVYLLLGISHVEFPHYVLLVLPMLGVFAGLALSAVGKHLPRPAMSVVGLVVAGSLLPTVTSDLKLLRVASAPSTQAMAGAAVARLAGPVVEEQYTSNPSVGMQVASIGGDAQVLSCACYVVISSYMEQRYERAGHTYAAQAALYRAVRNKGRVVEVIAPMVPLAYNWDVLPRWGLEHVPLRGRLGGVGPTITIVDLRHPS